MRHVGIDQARKVQQRRPLRVAQQPEAKPDPAADPAQGAGADPAAPVTVPSSPEASAEANISEAELLKMAEDAAGSGSGTQGEEVIVVTGSTIERRELTTAAPVTVMDKADLDGAGLVTVGDILQALPAQSNAANAQVNNGGDGATRVNLRGLGSNRTLVLINGRRVVPGGVGADASVDMNAIPLAVIERVEVLKDGASAVYGSDAVGGVVNVITKTDYTGSEAALYTGMSERKDGLTYDASFVSGHASKKGNILFSAGFQHQDQVMAGDRAFSSVDKEWDYSEEDPSLRLIKSGSASIPQGRVNTNALLKDGQAAEMDLCGAQFCMPDGNGGWRPYDSATDVYNFQPENYLYTPSTRYNLFATGGYKLGEGKTRVFFEGLYLNRTSDQMLAPEPFTPGHGVPISAQSMYNPLGADVVGYNRRLTEFGRRKSLQNIDTFRIVGGFDGKAPEELPVFGNWKWETSYNYGRTTGVQRNEGNLNLTRLANALGPSFMDGSTPTCGTPDAPIAGCVPMNIMGGGNLDGTGSVTKEMRDYVTFTGISNGYNEQHTALARTGGRLLQTPWGGDISLAVGGGYRQEAGGFTPDPLTATGETTGNASAPTEGSYNSFEGFTELSVVPVAGREAAEWLEFTGAARAFRYNNFGSGVTWKLGGLYKAVAGIAVRGTYSSAFRAPSVGELYQGQADGFPSVEDPCDVKPPSAGGDVIELDPAVQAECSRQGVPVGTAFNSAQQRSVGGGNESLTAETARVLTAGVVYEPEFLKGVSLTADYFQIRIDDAIQSLGSSIILSNCFDYGMPEYCDAIHRDPTDPTHQIDFIDDPIDNVGSVETRGIDAALAIELDTPAGRFRNQLEGTYLRQYTLTKSTQVLQGVGNYDLGVFPRFKANNSLTWGKDGVSAGANLRWIGSFRECDGGTTCNALVAEGEAMLKAFSRDVGASYTADLFAGYEFKSVAGLTRWTVGVNNVLDRDPQLIYTGFAGDSDSSTYDYMGRYFYTRLSQSF